jgi:hypothetical protein
MWVSFEKQLTDGDSPLQTYSGFWSVRFEKVLWQEDVSSWCDERTAFAKSLSWNHFDTDGRAGSLSGGL